MTDQPTDERARLRERHNEFCREQRTFGIYWSKIPDYEEWVESLALAAEADLALRTQQLHEHAETIAKLRADLADATTELEKSKQWAVKLGAELDKGDSWAWIRGKFEKCGTHLKWFKPREDSLAGTRYEVMGWLHVLFAEASPKVYIDIAIEHQKKADDAERLLADATAQRDALIPFAKDYAAKHTRYMYNGKENDPLGVHALLDELSRVQKGEKGENQ